MVYPLTIYWMDGSRPRDDLAAREENEAEEMAWTIEHSWPGVLAVHVEAPTENEDDYEILERSMRAPFGDGIRTRAGSEDEVTGERCRCKIIPFQR